MLQAALFESLKGAGVSIEVLCPASLVDLDLSHCGSGNQGGSLHAGGVDALGSDDWARVEMASASPTEALSKGSPLPMAETIKHDRDSLLPRTGSVTLSKSGWNQRRRI